MRLASFNVENLFDRAKAMNGGNEAANSLALEQFAALNALLAQVTYNDADKAKIIGLLGHLGLTRQDKGPLVILRQNKGKLLKRPRAGGVEVVANGRADWAGMLELLDEPVDEHAMRNTARVMGDIGADVLGLVEVESRPVVVDFNKHVLPRVGAKSFDHVMVIDGNDERGIDVGLATRAGYDIGIMRSHVDDRPSPRAKPTFSRDCPEYEVTTRDGGRLLVLVNHLKSKFDRDQKKANARRHAQAVRVAEIYTGLVGKGEKHIAIIGDLNDTPESPYLKPLLKDTDLKDVSVHSKFNDGGFPGTFGSCGPDNKIDYILLSPALFAKVTAGGVFRKGAWPGKRDPKWEVYPEVDTEAHAASDHCAIWVDLDI